MLPAFRGSPGFYLLMGIGAADRCCFVWFCCVGVGLGDGVEERSQTLLACIVRRFSITGL